MSDLRAIVSLRHQAPDEEYEAVETWALVPLGDVVPGVSRWVAGELASLEVGGRVEVQVFVEEVS